MHRSTIPSLVALGLFSLVAFGGGCIIVAQPGPNGASSAAPPPGNQSKVPVNQPATAAAATTAAPAATTAAPAAGPPGPKTNVGGKDYITLSKPVAFGNGDNKPGAFHGLVYWLPATTTALPNFDTLAPAGVLFTQGFNVFSSGYTEGFPGLDAGRTDFFGIRYEGDFAASATGDFTFRLESDDGARLIIDSLPVVVVDGVHTAQVKTNVVKLAAGPHRFRLDYFQAARGAVSLRVSVSPPGGPEKPFAAVFLARPLCPSRPALR